MGMEPSTSNPRRMDKEKFVSWLNRSRELIIEKLPSKLGNNNDSINFIRGTDRCIKDILALVEEGRFDAKVGDIEENNKGVIKAFDGSNPNKLKCYLIKIDDDSFNEYDADEACVVVAPNKEKAIEIAKKKTSILFDYYNTSITEVNLGEEGIILTSNTGA